MVVTDHRLAYSSKPRLQRPGCLRKNTKGQSSPAPASTPRPSHPSTPRSFHRRGRPARLDLYPGPSTRRRGTIRCGSRTTISRLIDGYAEGLIDKDEFTLRIRRAKDRSAHLEGQLQFQADLTAQRGELLLIITRLEDFTSRIKDGLHHADWGTKRDLVRALVRRVEIGPDGANVVFRVDPAIPPSVPPGGIMPDCTRGERSLYGEIGWRQDGHGTKCSPRGDGPR